MPKLGAHLIANLDTVAGMQAALQNAIELEHATLPTYLYAMFSIKPNSNKSIYGLIHSIVMEEMLHMGLACNILNAIGGSPDIDNPTFIPKYPGPLPNGVEADLTVPLAPLSLDLVKKVFMVIEEPEKPENFPVKGTSADLPATELTIGEFYEEIKAGLCALTNTNPNLWRSNHNQVTGILGLIPVSDYKSAAAAIDIIVEQGEGTTSINPMEPGSSTVPAHYYRFAEIVNGKSLLADSSTPLGYSYSGNLIPFDSDGVYPAIVNPSLHPYPENSPAWTANKAFNTTYSTLLKCLHDAFNGITSSQRLSDAIACMDNLPGQAGAVMSIDLGNGINAGPSFEYQADAPTSCT